MRSLRILTASSMMAQLKSRVKVGDHNGVWKRLGGVILLVDGDQNPRPCRFISAELGGPAGHCPGLPESCGAAAEAMRRQEV
jgi:hypothetical protein